MASLAAAPCASPRVAHEALLPNRIQAQRTTWHPSRERSKPRKRRNLVFAADTNSSLEEVGHLSRVKPSEAQLDTYRFLGRPEWKEYDTAVESMDLERALEVLTFLQRTEDGGRTGNSSEDGQSRGIAPTTSLEAVSESFEKAVELPPGNGSATFLDETFSKAAMSGTELPRGTLSESRSDFLPSLEVLNEASLALSPDVKDRFLRLLDSALLAEDMKLVGRAYDWLQARGLLTSFGQAKATISDAPRLVTPAVLKASAGIEAAKLSPKKWGSASALPPLLTFAAMSALVNNGVEIRPVLALLLAVGVLDSTFLGGAGISTVLSQWKPYKRRVAVHEAGHVVVAYLLGCPIRGVVLSPSEALRVGIQGQAGTQFWDERLEEEVKSGRLTGQTIDRYCCVLFGGIAAEALLFGEANGGESDENMFKALVGQLRPMWPQSKVANQARWAVLQAVLLLRRHATTHKAVVEALEEGRGLGEIVDVIERSLARG